MFTFLSSFDTTFSPFTGFTGGLMWNDSAYFQVLADLNFVQFEGRNYQDKNSDLLIRQCFH